MKQYVKYEWLTNMHFTPVPLNTEWGCASKKNLEGWQEKQEKGIHFISIKATWKSLFFAFSEKVG